MLQILNNIDILEWITIGVITIIFLVRIFFYFSQVKLLSQIKHTKKGNYLVPVSVIIAAKNEAENLQKFLPDILEQDYPDFEVIVVDDGSTDDTALILENFKKKYAHLVTTYIKPDKKFRHGKKLAITIGIKAAKNEFFVFTDADCHVQSDRWIERMSRNFKENDLVLGFGGYDKENSFLNKLVRYDTVKIAILYFSKALSGKPYMGVGRNLAYTKNLYERVKGFSSHYHIPTGDDDLFVREASTYAKTAIETTPESFTLSVPPQSFKEWQRQKSRHLRSSNSYSFGQKTILGIESFARGTFHLFAIVGIILFPEILFPVLIIILIDLIIKLTLSGNLLHHFGNKDLILFEIFFDIIIPFLIFVRLIMNIFTRQKRLWT